MKILLCAIKSCSNLRNMVELLLAFGRSENMRLHYCALVRQSLMPPHWHWQHCNALWPLHFRLCDKWQLENSHGWGASGGFYEKLSEYIRVHYCAASSQTGPSVTTLAFMASPTVTTAESVFYFQQSSLHSSDILSARQIFPFLHFFHILFTSAFKMCWQM